MFNIFGSKKNKNEKICWEGDDCKFYKQGNCRYYHPKPNNTDKNENDDIPEEVKENKEDEGLPKKFKILCQNIWCILVIGGAQKQKRLKLLIENIKNEEPDIICFQELFLFSVLYLNAYNADVSFVNDELAKLGYTYCNKPKESFLFGLNNGLMIYSKYTFKECKFHSYNKEYLTFPRNIINRGLIAGLFKINNTKSSLLVVNTHFENKDRKTKIHSINALSNYLKNDLKCDNIQYVLCCGDFNICSNGTWELDIKNKENRLYYILSKQLSISCGLNYDLCSGKQRTLRKTDVDKNAIYDHCFVNENLKAINVKTEIKDWKQNDLIVSDHYGIMAHFHSQ